MLYESDVSSLLAQWRQRIYHLPVDTAYKDGVNDCIYDLQTLMDKYFQEEALASEAFEQQLQEDAKYWSDYYATLFSDDGLHSS